MGATKKNLDFTNVKEGGDFTTRHLPDGDYPAKVLKVVDHQSKKGDAMWLFTIGLTGGGTGAKGATYPYYCGFEEQVLWKIRNLATSAGLNVPKKRVGLDPDKLVGKAIGVTLESDEYDGKVKSKIVAVLPLSEIEEGDDAEDDDAEVDDKDIDETVAVDDDEMEELEVEDL